jgi:hypothetical protein
MTGEFRETALLGRHPYCPELRQVGRERAANGLGESFGIDTLAEAPPHHETGWNGRNLVQELGCCHGCAEPAWNDEEEPIAGPAKVLDSFFAPPHIDHHGTEGASPGLEHSPDGFRAHGRG